MADPPIPVDSLGWEGVQATASTLSQEVASETGPIGRIPNPTPPVTGADSQQARDTSCTCVVVEIAAFGHQRLNLHSFVSAGVAVFGHSVRQPSENRMDVLFEVLLGGEIDPFRVWVGEASRPHRLKGAGHLVEDLSHRQRGDHAQVGPGIDDAGRVQRVRPLSAENMQDSVSWLEPVSDRPVGLRHAGHGA